MIILNAREYCFVFAVMSESSLYMYLAPSSSSAMHSTRHEEAVAQVLLNKKFPSRGGDSKRRKIFNDYRSQDFFTCTELNIEEALNLTVSGAIISPLSNPSVEIPCQADLIFLIF